MLSTIQWDFREELKGLTACKIPGHFHDQMSKKSHCNSFFSEQSNFLNARHFSIQECMWCFYAKFEKVDFT